jgi:hypothetical protein
MFSVHKLGNFTTATALVGLFLSLFTHVDTSRMVIDALAQTGCVGNPNVKPPFVNGCPLPPRALNLIIQGDLRFFGGDPTGVNDSEPALVAALGSGIVSIYLPQGSYVFNHNLPAITQSGIKICGAGMGATQIFINTTTGDAIAVGDNISLPTNITLCDLSLISNATRTSGALLKVINARNFLGNNLYIGNAVVGSVTNQPFDGVVFAGSSSSNALNYQLTNFYVTGATNKNVYIGGSGIYVQGATLQNGYITWGKWGLYLDNVSGGTFENLNVLLASSDNIVINPLTGSSPGVFWTFWNMVFADASTGGSGWDLLGTGHITGFNCVQCWGSSNAVDGMSVSNTNVDRAIITNSIFTGNTTLAINWAATNSTNVIIADNHFEGNPGLAFASPLNNASNVVRDNTPVTGVRATLTTPVVAVDGSHNIVHDQTFNLGGSTISSFTTIETITPSTVTNIFETGSVHVTTGAYTNTTGHQDVCDAVQNFFIANAAPTVSSNPTCPANAPKWKLVVSGNDIQVQVSSDDATNTILTGMARVVVQAPAGNFQWSF